MNINLSDSPCMFLPWQITSFPWMQRESTVEASHRIRKSSLLWLVKPSSGEILGRRASSSPAGKTSEPLVVRWFRRVLRRGQQRNQERTCWEVFDMRFKRIVRGSPGLQLPVTINTLKTFECVSFWVLIWSYFGAKFQVKLKTNLKTNRGQIWRKFKPKFEPNLKPFW